MKPTLYMETSIVSYLTARPSRDLIALAHQEITRKWWSDALPKFQVFISEVVIDEAKRGDIEAARKRLKALEDFAGLPILQEVEDLAEVYMKEFNLPPDASRDALHIAVASVHAIDYLLTWNCSHIANGVVRKRIREINTREGFSIPIICTPEELKDEI